MKDSRHKYIDISTNFNRRASEIDMTIKYNNRVIEKLAKHYSRVRPANPVEFEQVEFMKEFLLKTSTTNEKTLELLQYMTGFLQEIMDDAQVLIEGAILRDKLIFQSETIEALRDARDKEVDRIRADKTNIKRTA